MRFWYDNERDCKMSEPDCVDEYLFDIWAIGYDYDGCHSVEDLKKLIDYLIELSQKARDCLWDNKLFGVHGSPDDNKN